MTKLWRSSRSRFELKNWNIVGILCQDADVVRPRIRQIQHKKTRHADETVFCGFACRLVLASCILSPVVCSSFLLREWTMLFVGAKGEKLLLENKKNYATVTCDFFDWSRKKSREKQYQWPLELIVRPPDCTLLPLPCSSKVVNTILNHYEFA